MAFSYEPSGFQYNPLAPKLEDGNLLSGIKPLQIPQQGPVQISAPPAWTVPNLPMPPRVEGIASGITTAINAIGQGVTAAYKDKREDEREARKAKIAADTKAAEQEETKRHHLEMEQNATERIKNVLPANWGDGGDETTSILRKAPTVQPQARQLGTSIDSRYERHAPVKGGSFKTINLLEEDEANAGTFRLQSTSSPLAGLTDPAPIESAPTPTGESALSALANTDWAKVTGNYIAGTGAGPVASIPQAVPSFAKPKPPASLSTLGGISNAEMANIQQQLQEMPMQQAQPVSAPKYGIPEAAFRSYGEARRYIESQAENPDWYAEGIPKPDKSGLFIIPWKKKDKSAMAAETFKEEDKLRSDYLSQSKNFQVMQSSWNNLKEKAKDPSGASDMSLIFAYMKLLDPNSTVREGEYANARNVGTIPQSLWGQYNKAVSGEGFLDPKVRETFIKEAKGMYDNALSAHQQTVDQFSQIAKSYNLDPKRVVIDLVPKQTTQEINTSIKTQISDAQQRMKQYHLLMVNAGKKKDAEAYAKARQQYDAAKAEQDSLYQKIK